MGKDRAKKASLKLAFFALLIVLSFFFVGGYRLRLLPTTRFGQLLSLIYSFTGLTANPLEMLKPVAAQ